MVVDLILGKKKLIIKNKNMPYRQSPNKMKKSPMEAGCGSPAKAKSPYMMYGKESGAMMSESPLAKYGCSKKYAKSPAKLNGGEDEKLKAADKTGQQSQEAKEAISKSKTEGYKTTSVKEKDNVRSTVMELKPKKPGTVDVPTGSEQTKQFVGLSTPRKGLGRILGQYKTVKTDIGDKARQTYAFQKSQGKLESFESLGKKAKRN